MKFTKLGEGLPSYRWSLSKSFLLGHQAIVILMLLAPGFTFFTRLGGGHILPALETQNSQHPDVAGSKTRHFLTMANFLKN